VLLQILFAVAIAIFLYTTWRERRGEIELWPVRARTSFYGAAGLILATSAPSGTEPAFRADGARVLPRPRDLRFRDVPGLARPAHVLMTRRFLAVLALAIPVAGAAGAAVPSRQIQLIAPTAGNVTSRR